MCLPSCADNPLLANTGAAYAILRVDEKATARLGPLPRNSHTPPEKRLIKEKGFGKGREEWSPPGTDSTRKSDRGRESGNPCADDVQANAALSIECIPTFRKRRMPSSFFLPPQNPEGHPITAHFTREEVLETPQNLVVSVVIASVVGDVGLQRGTAAAPTSTSQPLLWYDNRNPPTSQDRSVAKASKRTLLRTTARLCAVTLGV